MQTIIRKLFYLTIIILGVAISSAFAAPIFIITPSMTNNTISTNSLGVVKYTVTNNTNKTLSQIIVNPAYKAGGSLSGVSLQNDSCSNTTLASQESCTFQLVLSGAQQETTITLSPKICALNGAVCSIPVDYLRTQVTIVSAQNTPSAYFGLTNLGKLQPVLTSNNSLQASIPGFDLTSVTGVAVSKDGTKVYVANGGAHNMIIYNVTQGTTTTVPLNLSLQTIKKRNLNAPASAQGIAVTPDGSKVYIADGSNGIWVYNTVSGKIVTNITHQTYLSNPGAIAVSPDGAFVYVTNQNFIFKPVNKKRAQSSPATGYVTVISTATNTITNQVEITSPLGIAVSPDGTQLYVVSSIFIGRHRFIPAESNLTILDLFGNSHLANSML